VEGKKDKNYKLADVFSKKHKSKKTQKSHQRLKKTKKKSPRWSRDFPF
tara:strand:+ start:58 stop:201 length:144 start_codon:yes stop_codon:yes gene_type:complete